MPTKTLLEYFNQYIPHHIFKNVILDPADAEYNNYCIIFDGVGIPMCFKFSNDDERSESLASDNKQELLCGINFYKMLRMKVWFNFTQNIIKGVWEEDDRKYLIKERIYDLFVEYFENPHLDSYLDWEDSHLDV